MILPKHAVSISSTWSLLRYCVYLEPGVWCTVIRSPRCDPLIDRSKQTGGSATLVLDADKRMLHAALHSAGHAIDHAVLEAVGKGVLKPSKGYHFADSPYVEYEGKLPDGLEKDALIEKARNYAQRFCFVCTSEIHAVVELRDRTVLVGT